MRLIDADALLKRLQADPLFDLVERYGVSGVINAEPTVDAVHVIRCKDCKFLRFTGTVWKCQNRLVMMLCEPNDFCSRAERKEE